MIDITMHRPDLIVVWPKNLDYPPFRMFVRYYRELFGKVIVVWTDAPSLWDFTKEVESHMDSDGVVFMYSYTKPGEDWRNQAINMGLNVSNSDWVLFMEQDFFIRGGKDLEEIWNSRDNFELIGFKEGDRLHPAFLLTTKRLINKTSKDFSARPDEGYDHFGKFTSELKTKPVLLDDLGIIKDEGYTHMNGLSHNFSLCMTSNTQYIYRKKDFEDYLNKSELNIEVSPKYKDLLALCHKELEKK